jgi:hypothetical protein
MYTYTDFNTLLQSSQNLEPLFRGLIAILLVLGGWLAAKITGRIIIAFLNKLRFNQVIKRLGWKDILEKAEFHIDGSKFFGRIVELVVFVFFMMLSFDVAGIDYIANLLTKIVSYLPNIIIASLIFIAAVFVSDFSYRIVIASTGKKVSYSKLVGTVLRWIIWVFAILAILLQLGIAPDIIKAITYGIIAMIALAGGLAFGLGGKDTAAQILEEIKNKFS